MAEPPIEETVPQSEHYRRWLLLAGGGIAVIVVLALLIRIATWPGNPGADGADAALPTSVDDLAANEQAIVQSLERERRSVARAQLIEVRQTADAALAALDELAREDQRWRSEVEALLTNDAGKRLAAAPDYLKAFEALYRGRVPLEPFAGNKRSLIATYVEPVDAALQGDGALYEPDPALLKQMESEVAEVNQRIAQARTTRESIAALSQSAPPPPVSHERAATLRVALQELAANYAAEQAAALAAVRDRAERAYRDQLVEVEERKLKEINAARLTQRESELEAQRAAIESETKRAETEARFERLRKLAEDESIQAKYQVFLAKGAYMFGTRPGTGNRVYQPPRPASYNRLVSLGILRDVGEFARAASGAGYYGRNDRPKWKAPSSEEQWDKYRELHREFQQLAPIWRDMGLLSP